MSRRYDSRTTIFSPEGRLYQVEYAMEAISNAGASIGMLAKDGVVLVAEKKITSKVPCRNPRCSLDKRAWSTSWAVVIFSYAAAWHTCCGRQKGEDVQVGWAHCMLSGRHHRWQLWTIYTSSPDFRLAYLGMYFLFAADANILINICRMAAQRYLYAYQEPMPVEQLVKSVCDTKQVSMVVVSISNILLGCMWS